MADNPIEIGLSPDKINLNFVEQPDTEQSEPDSDDKRTNSEDTKPQQHDNKEKMWSNFQIFVDGFNTFGNTVGNTVFRNHSTQQDNEKETWSDNMRTFMDGLYGHQYQQDGNVGYLEYFSEELKENDKYNIIGIFGGSCLVYNTETMMIESHNCVVELPPKKNVVVQVEGTTSSSPENNIEKMDEGDINSVLTKLKT